MKVALFLFSLQGGGAERVAVTLANALSSRGFEVEVVLISADGPYLFDLKSAVRVVNLKAKRVFLGLFPFSRYLKMSNPDVVVSFLDSVNIVSIAARKLSRRNFNLIITEHNSIKVGAAHHKKLRRRMLPLLMRLLYRYADSIVAVSAGVAEDLVNHIRIDRGKVRVIYNPVITEGLQILKDEIITDDFFLNDKRPLVLAVGRLTQQKDFITLIRAFDLVRTRCDARLIILGEGEARPALEALVERLGLVDQVMMPGFVENPYKYMKAARVFVLSSAWEGLSNVLIEALACGTPVVSTDCESGPREVLNNGMYGALVPVGDYRAMATAIEVELTGSLATRPFGALERYHVDEACNQYIALF